MEYRLEQSLLSQYGPDVSSHESRSDILKLLTEIVFKSFPGLAVQVGQYGSFPLGTFLKSGDLDITLLSQDIPFFDVPTLLLSRLHQQFEYLTKSKPDYNIQDLTLIDAEVPILKLKIKKVSVDITVNQVKGLGVVALFQEFNKIIPDNLLKRSIVLGKIWATYYGRILGAMYGGLTTYALEVLILFIINAIPESRKSPVDVLQHLITFFASFDWGNNVVTICKALSISEYISVVTHRTEMFRGLTGMLITPEKYSEIKNRLQISGDIMLMPLKCMNILDPFDSANNLGRSASLQGCERIKTAFQISSEILARNGMEALFKGSKERIQPQIMVHAERVRAEVKRENSDRRVQRKEFSFKSARNGYPRFHNKNKRVFRVFNEGTHKDRIRT